MIFSHYLRGQRPAPLPQRMLQHAGDTAACGTFTPEDGSPVALVIGAMAKPDDVRRLAKRHGLQVDSLLTFAKGIQSTQGARHA